MYIRLGRRSSVDVTDPSARVQRSSLSLGAWPSVAASALIVTVGRVFSFIDDAAVALECSRLADDEEVGIASVDAAVQSLVDVVMTSIDKRDLVPVHHDAEAIARERLRRTGVDIAELQTSINGPREQGGRRVLERGRPSSRGPSRAIVSAESTRSTTRGHRTEPQLHRELLANMLRVNSSRCWSERSPRGPSHVPRHRTNDARSIPHQGGSRSTASNTFWAVLGAAARQVGQVPAPSAEMSHHFAPSAQAARGRSHRTPGWLGSRVLHRRLGGMESRAARSVARQGTARSGGTDAASCAFVRARVRIRRPRVVLWTSSAPS